MSEVIQDKRKRAETWSYDETKCLVDLWANEQTQKSLGEMCRNKAVWTTVTNSLNSLMVGPTRDWKQVKEKMRGLVSSYRKAVDGNHSSGAQRKTSPFFKEIDQVLGCRALTTPLYRVESSVMDQSDSSREIEPAISGDQRMYEVINVERVESQINSRPCSELRAEVVVTELNCSALDTSEEVTVAGGSHSSQPSKKRKNINRKGEILDHLKKKEENDKQLMELLIENDKKYAEDRIAAFNTLKKEIQHAEKRQNEREDRIIKEQREHELKLTQLLCERFNK